MSKRIAELEEQAKKLKAEAKRLRHESALYKLMDEDLAAWKSKLQKEAIVTPDKWKLVFFSPDYNGLLQMYMYSYGPTLFSQHEWSSEAWESCQQRGQNMGGIKIAYAPTETALWPPPLAAKRFAIFGFTYVICPTDLQLPKRFDALQYPEFKPYVYGYTGLVDLSVSSDCIPPMVGIASPNLQSPHDVDLLYNYVETKVRDGRDSGLVELMHDLMELEAKKQKLLAKVETLESTWAKRMLL
jgi:hypothetical protein